MRRVIGRLAMRWGRVRAAGDRGAIGVTVGVLLGSGVLLGVGAIVVDVGQLYVERAELQNGADAGALAMAKGCALGSTTCLPATAATYANANAKDGAAAVDLVCGYAGAGVLPQCPAPTGRLASCPSPQPATGTTYVEVHTSTRTAGGSTLLPPVFARTLLGKESYDGTNVGACARAVWGSPKASQAFAMTISYCEWMKATNNGTKFAPAPPYPPNPAPTPAMDRVLKLHTTSKTSCPGGPAGADGPGMFGWVDDPGGACSVHVSGTSYAADTGASAGNSCKALLASAWASRQVIFIPVFTAATGNGSGGSYTLAGFGAFVVTGYHLPGADASDWLKPSNNCKGSDKCINGYFTQGLVPSSGVIGGPDLGVSVIQLTG